MLWTFFIHSKTLMTNQNSHCIWTALRKWYVNKLLIILAAIKSNFIREFFCTSRTLQLGVKKPSFLKLLFLPFDMKKRYCIIILSHKQVRAELHGMLSCWHFNGMTGTDEQVATEDFSNVVYFSPLVAKQRVSPQE